MSFQLQDFDAPEISVVREILRQTWIAGHSHDDVAGTLDLLLKEPSLTFLLPKAGEKTTLAFSDEQPVGVLVTRRAHGSNHVLGLYVLPHFHRRGIGGMLIAHAAEQSKGMALELEVMESNRIAVAFYTALGFVEVCRRHVQLKEGLTLTVLVMTRPGTDSGQAPSLALVGTNPQGLGLGDLNGDGNLDLAVSNLGPNSIALGDLNGDGKLDIAAANSGAATTVSVLLGKGDGSFAVHVDYVAGGLPRTRSCGHIRCDHDGVGDVNIDGTLDIATDKGNRPV